MLVFYAELAIMATSPQTIAELQTTRTSIQKLHVPDARSEPRSPILTCLTVVTIECKKPIRSTSYSGLDLYSHGKKLLRW